MGEGSCHFGLDTAAGTGAGLPDAAPAFTWREVEPNTSPLPSFCRHSHVLSLCVLLLTAVSPHNLCVPSGERRVGAGSAHRSKHLARSTVAPGGRRKPGSGHVISSGNQAGSDPITVT